MNEQNDKKGDKVKNLYLVKDKKSSFYQYRFVTENGQSGQVSTAARDPETAHRLLGGMDLIKEALQQRLLRGKQFVSFVKLLYATVTGIPLNMTLATSYFQQYLDHTEVFNDGSTVYNQRRAVALFSDYIQDMGLLLDEIKVGHIKGFCVWLAKTHGPSSINNRLDVLTTIFNTAVKDGLIEENPAKNVRAPDRKADAEDDELKRQPFKQVEIRKLVASGVSEGLNPELAVACLMALDLGSRIGDTFALQRHYYNRETGEMRYYIRKLGIWHTVVLFPETQLLLNEYLDHHLLDEGPQATLFPSFAVPNGPEVKATVYRSAASKTSNAISDFFMALGFRSNGVVRENGRTHYDLAFHSFRATSNTAMKTAGMQEEVAMARLAHKTKKSNQKYDRFNVANVCAAVFQSLGKSVAVTPQVLAAKSITLKEIVEEMTVATARLQAFRGKLDLHNGIEIRGQSKRRARLQLVSQGKLSQGQKAVIVNTPEQK